MDQSASSSEGPKQIPSAPPVPTDTAVPGSVLTPGETLAPTVVPTEPTHMEMAPQPVPGQSPPTEPVALAAVKQRHSFRPGLIVGLLLLLNTAIGGGNVYYRMAQQTSAAISPASTKQSQVAASSTAPTAATPPKNDVTTLHYVSEPLKLEFDYPVDWRIASTSDNTSITVSSAPFQLTDPTGLKQASKINLTVSNAPASSYFDATPNGTITADSETLAYTQPTTVQRTKTNISFASASPGSEPGISTVFVSGTNVYKTGETVATHDYSKVTPHVSLYVDTCAGGQCHQALATSNFSLDDWHTGTEFVKAKAMIASMRFN